VFLCAHFSDNQKYTLSWIALAKSMNTPRTFGRLQTSLLYAALSLFCFLQPANSATVNLQGTMDTTAILSDNVIIRVPHGVPSLVIRFPVLKSDINSESVAASNTQVIDGEDIVCSISPTDTRVVEDSAGNPYKELTFTSPPSGDIKIQAKTGRIDLAADLNTPLPHIAMPLSTDSMPSSVVKYLDPSQYVQSDSPEIERAATDIVGNASTESDAAQRISYWLRQNISYGGYLRLNGTDAISVLHERTSICCGWAHLFIALARASGIPARFVDGYVIGGSFTYPTSEDGMDKVTTFNGSLMHAWVELWYPHQGWVAYDPQSSAGFVDTHHVRLWASVDGGSSLPLVSWQSFGSVKNVTFTETESASDVSDQSNLHCYGRQDDRHPGPIMLTR
jgi:Transglutaminase-like superfamily